MINAGLFKILSDQLIPDFIFLSYFEFIPDQVLWFDLVIGLWCDHENFYFSYITWSNVIFPDKSPNFFQQFFLIFNFISR